MSYSFIGNIRNEALFRIYKELRDTGEYKSVKHISEALAEMEMPLHFISYRQARLFYNNYFYRGKTRTDMHPANRRLYQSFLDLCIALRKPGHQPADDRSVIAKALLAPAPCVGLDAVHIARILQSMGAH